MKRIVLVVALAATGLLAPAPRVDALDLNGRWDPTDLREVENAVKPLVVDTEDIEVTARMYGGYPRAERTYVRCELRPFSPDDPPVWSATRFWSGPVGLMAEAVGINTTGVPLYACTVVWTAPLYVETDYGCFYALTT